jgi:hypothetical protein
MRARFRKDVRIAGTILFPGSVRSQPSCFQLRKSRKDDSLELPSVSPIRPLAK